MEVTSQPPSSVLPRAWEEVLARVQQALERAEQEAARREQPRVTPEPNAGREAAWQQGLHGLDARLRHLGDLARQAERETAAAEADWSEGEEAVKQWLGARDQLARALASWAAPEAP
jgi:hypothetical protein